MPAQIIDDMDESIIIRFLYNTGKLQIYPKNSLNSADFSKPLVVLLHGLDGSMGDMTDPLGNREKREKIFAYDIDWKPDVINKGWHSHPPEFTLSLIEDFIESLGSMDLADFLEIFNDYIPVADIQMSPLIKPSDKNRSWFDFFETEGYPVIAYQQSGTKIPTDDGAYPEFLELMEDIHTNLLKTSSCRKVALLGHSRGGFIARRYIIEALYPSGDLYNTIHHEIVADRVRFLGALNSPLFGSNLAMSPKFVDAIGNSIIPFLGIGGLLSNELQNLAYDDSYLDAFYELATDNPNLQLLNIHDLILLEANYIDNSFDDINLSVLGSDELKRIRRASTSGDRPAVRRFFSPHFYDLSSFSPDYICMLACIANPFCKIPKCFHHTQSFIELAFSPFVDDYKPPTFMDVALGFILLSGGSGGLPITELPHLEEFHARREIQLHEGGDLLVGCLKGRLLFAHHKTFSYHHYFALWNEGFKKHIEENIPMSFCYPKITFKVGDNIVELDWVRTSLIEQVRVIRFEQTGDTIPTAESRSPPLPNTETLYYDIVNVRNPLSYLISYYVSSSDNWAHRLDDQAYRESTEVGSLAVNIQEIINEEEQEFHTAKSRIASSRVENNFLIFSVNHEDLLSDCINANLEPIGTRINITNYASEEDGLNMKLSVPYANSYKEGLQNPDKGLVAWVEYKSTPISGSDSTTVNGTTDDDTYLRSENDRIGPVPGVKLYAEGCLHLFRVMAGFFDINGRIDNIKEILPITCAYFENDSNCAFESLGIDIMEPPLFKKCDSGFIFVTAGGSPFRLYIIITDENLTLISHRYIQLRNPVVNTPAHGCPINSSNLSSLKLHDLVSVRDGEYFIAILGKAGLDNDLYIVRFEISGNDIVTSINLPWETTRVQSTVFSEDNDKLLLFASSPIANNPRFAFIPINGDGTLDIDSIDWTYISINELINSHTGVTFEKIQVQDKLSQCDNNMEFLISMTGYFQKEEISSSLYRIKINRDSTYSYSLLHHSGFGKYSITWSRVNYESSQNAVFWLNPEGSIFSPGLYGQLLQRSVPGCSDLSHVAVFETNLFLRDFPFEFKWVDICDLIKNLPYGKPFCDSFSDPRFWMEFKENPVIRGKVYDILKCLRDLVLPIKEKKLNLKYILKTKPGLVNRFERKLIQFLDYLTLQNLQSFQKRFTNLKDSLKWVHPIKRATQLNDEILKKITISEQVIKKQFKTFEQGKFWIPGSISKDDLQKMKED